MDIGRGELSVCPVSSLFLSHLPPPWPAGGDLSTYQVSPPCPSPPASAHCQAPALLLSIFFHPIPLPGHSLTHCLSTTPPPSTISCFSQAPLFFQDLFFLELLHLLLCILAADDPLGKDSFQSFTELLRFVPAFAPSSQPRPFPQLLLCAVAPPLDLSPSSTLSLGPIPGRLSLTPSSVPYLTACWLLTSHSPFSLPHAPFLRLGFSV